MRKALTFLLAAGLLVAAAPSAGAAETRLPVGEANGVRLVRERGPMVVVFTQRAEWLWRRVAGNRVSFECEERSEPDEQGFVTISEGGATYRMPKRGRRLNTGDRTRGLDLCRVLLEPRRVGRGRQRRRYPRELIVAIPLTQRAAVFLDEQARARVLGLVLTYAAIDGRRQGLEGYPAPAEFVARLPFLRRPIRLSQVALASPSETPPAGAVGYYSDGADRAAAVVLSAAGRRLFLEFEGDGVVRSNVITYLFGEDTAS